MYDIIKDLINHVWQSGTSASGDQQYIYYICGAVIIVLTVTFIDLVFRIIRSLVRF